MKSFDPEIETAVQYVARLEAEIDGADKALCNLLGEYGWATGHGDTLCDLVGELRANMQALNIHHHRSET